MGANIESKVLIPAVAGFVTAVLGLGAAFGLDLDETQQKSILGAVVAAIVLLQIVLGYLAPHTKRPDLAAEEPPPAPPQTTVNVTTQPDPAPEVEPVPTEGVVLSSAEQEAVLVDLENRFVEGEEPSQALRAVLEKVDPGWVKVRQTR